MEKTVDEILMLNVKNGKLGDMAEIFERYHVRLYNFFLRMGMKSYVCQDLTQNLFYRMLKYRDSYREGESVKSWIYQIARNLYNDYYNEQRRHESLVVLTDNLPPDIPDEPGIFGEEEYARLDDALLALPPEQRELIVLSRFQGLKYSEVSVIVNQSVPAIKTGIFRALKKLRSIYFKQV